MKTRTAAFLLLALGVSTGFADVDDGLVAYFPFDNGDVSDATGHGNDGVIVGNVQPAPDRSSCTNGALRFSGPNCYVMTPMFTLGTNRAFTFSAWVCPQAGNVNNDYRVFTYKSGAVQISVGLLQSPVPAGRIVQTLVYFHTSVRTEYSALAHLDYGTWYLYTVTYDGADIKSYLNNKCIGGAYTDNQPVNVPAPLLMGGTREDVDFKGSIDECRIYNRALSSGEIDELYGESSVDWTGKVMLQVGCSPSSNGAQNVSTYFADERIYFAVQDINLDQGDVVMSASITGLQYQKGRKPPRIKSTVVRLRRDAGGVYRGSIALNAFVPGRVTAVVSGSTRKRGNFSRTSYVTILPAEE